VAEGIEEPEQLERLLDMGCEFGQGFLFARPMPGDEVARLFARRQALASDLATVRAAHAERIA
jgi:EAL domain-containing protein (putative c-di-GMP-specific phosphodiesterase class I)